MSRDTDLLHRFVAGDVDAFEELMRAHEDRVFAIAQWYPRVAVYDDVYGWDVSPYLGDGEFYLEYGSFDVALTVPAGWLVGATGTLTNPDEVLMPAVARRRDSPTSPRAAWSVPGRTF